MTSASTRASKVISSQALAPTKGASDRMCFASSITASLPICLPVQSTMLSALRPWSMSLTAPAIPLPEPAPADRDRDDAEASAIASPSASEGTIAPAASRSPAPSRHCERVRWLGAEEQQVIIGSESFRLSFCYVGHAEDDPDNPTIIDPSFDLGSRQESAAPAGRHPVAYGDWVPAERRAYLQWLSTGRQSPAPRSFLLLFISSLEHAVVRDGHREELGEMRAELSRMMERYKDEAVFGRAAQQLLTACELVDNEFVPEPIHASAETNFRGEMPFKVRQFLGWMLQSPGGLEADAAFLFYLQQPGRRLEPLVAQYFREVSASWCLRYPALASGALCDHPDLPRLRLAYEPMLGAFSQTLVSDLPDVAALGVPSELEVLFRECATPFLHLREQPLAQVLANMPVPAIDSELGDRAAFEQRIGAGAWLRAMVPDDDPRAIEVKAILEALFECACVPPDRLLPKRVENAVTQLLDEHGFGFEPDARSGLPRSMRPDRRITIFHTDLSGHREPTDAFMLAQAAVVASSLAQAWYPALEPLALERIEERLPFRHRFNDPEMRRLAATEHAIATLDESPREFLRRWVRKLARTKRLDDLIGGFGIAFKGQRRNSQLPKLARALVLQSEGLVGAEDLLAAASETALPPSSFHQSLEVRVLSMLPEAQTSRSVRPEQPQAAEPAQGRTMPPALDGLESRHAELLLALADRARTRAELEELARTRRLTLAGAVDEINEWALLKSGSIAVSGEQDFTITLAARELLELGTASQ